MIFTLQNSSDPFVVPKHILLIWKTDESSPSYDSEYAVPPQTLREETDQNFALCQNHTILGS